MPNDLQAVRAAAIGAVAGMAARAMLDDARSEDAEVVAVRFEARVVAGGALDVDVEYIARNGMAVGGGSL